MFTSGIPHQGGIDDGTGRWSRMDQSQVRFELLHELCNASQDLAKRGYVVEPLTTAERHERLRCERCADSRPPPDTPTDVPPKLYGERQRMSRARCMYHTEEVVNDEFRCCGTKLSSKGDILGCHVAAKHNFRSDYETFLDGHWQYHHTPTVPALNWASLLQSGTGDYADAIALDCEYGTNQYGESELIRMSVVDFVSGRILIDKLVYPGIRMIHYNTKHSGIDKKHLVQAFHQQECLYGREMARDTLLKMIGPETVVIVHGGAQAFTSLRLIHPRIIDTSIFDKGFNDIPGGRSLKNLCDKRLGITIQSRDKSHCTLEHALAARELLWYYMHRPVKEAKADPGASEKGAVVVHADTVPTPVIRQPVVLDPWERHPPPLVLTYKVSGELRRPDSPRCCFMPGW